MSFDFKNKFSPEKINIIALLVLLLVISAVIGAFNVVLGMICFAATFISTAVSFFIMFWGGKNNVIEYTRSFSEKFSQRSGEVYIVADEDDRIVWRSGSFEKYFVINIISRPTLSQITNGQLSFSKISDYLKVNENEAIVVKTDDVVFNVSSRIEVINHKKYAFITLIDVSELEEIKNTLKSRDLTVAYAMIDNASEAMVYVSEKGREDSLRISAALHSWVQSINGIIREYDRDKYIIFFESNQLDEQIKDRFSFMDNINTAPADAFEINLTLSLGVAHIDGTMTEKEDAARNALELALQRGGAQTAVKTDDGTYYFGGRVRSVRKQTKIRSRVVASKLVSLVCNSSNVIIMGHKNADFDSIASCVGLARLCIHCGVPVNVVVNKSDRDVISAMEHLDKETYSEVFVDGIAGQDLIKPETLVIVSDVSNPVIFECGEIVENANSFVVIDHHRQGKEFEKKPDISYIEPTASSASELVCEILEHVLPPEATLKEEADLLYSGLILDTQNFSRNTGVRTFGAAIFLDNFGGSLERGRELLKADASEYKKLASVQAGVTIYKSVYAITIYEDDEDPNNRVIAAKAADSLLGIEGVKATFVLTAVDGDIHISARSDGSINVSLILETIGGGGHFNMAGARLEKSTMENAVLELKDAIEKYEKK